MGIGSDNQTGITAVRLDGFSKKVGTPSVTVLETDSSEMVTRAKGTTVPTDGDAGYAKGCIFVDTDASLGSILYLNEGSETSCDFNVVESGASNVTGVTAAAGLTGGGTSGTVSVAVGAGTGITVNADDVQIASAYLPSHVVKFAGTSSAYGGGGTSTAITVTGAAATDVATAVIRASTNDVSITKAVLTSNTLTVHFSADPGANTTVDYCVLRAVA